MTLGKGGFAGRRQRRRRETSVDLTPLIDIVFQLLIFFLLTATFQDMPSFKVKLPKAKNDDTTSETTAIMVSLGRDGRFEIDGVTVDEAELAKRLCVAQKRDAQSGVNIRADAEAMMGSAVKVMELARGCGLRKLNILHSR